MLVVVEEEVVKVVEDEVEVKMGVEMEEEEEVEVGLLKRWW